MAVPGSLFHENASSGASGTLHGPGGGWPAGEGRPVGEAGWREHRGAEGCHRLSALCHVREARAARDLQVTVPAANGHQSRVCAVQ